MLSESQEVDGWMGEILGIVDGAANELRPPKRYPDSRAVARKYPDSSAVVRNYTLLAKKIRSALTENWNAYSAGHNLSQPLDEQWAK